MRLRKLLATTGDAVGMCPRSGTGDTGSGDEETMLTVLIPLATFGVLGLAAVVLIHELAEIVVIGNGVRAGRTSPLGGSINSL